MKFTIDTNDLNPDQFGETLRNYFFTKGKGYGCYENFEVEPFMIRGVLPDELITKYFGDFAESYTFYAKQDDLNVWLAYSWDGDGILVVCDGTRVCINGDCKKDYG